MRHISLLRLVGQLGLYLILIFFVIELISLSQQLGTGSESITGSVLTGLSIDKSQFNNSTNIPHQSSTVQKISFIVKLNNNTGQNIQGGQISITILGSSGYVADPILAAIDLANGETQLVTLSWQTTQEIRISSCTVTATVYDAANDELGSLQESLNNN